MNMDTHSEGDACAVHYALDDKFKLHKPLFLLRCRMSNSVPNSPQLTATAVPLVTRPKTEIQSQLTHTHTHTHTIHATSIYQLTYMLHLHINLNITTESKKNTHIAPQAPTAATHTQPILCTQWKWKSQNINKLFAAQQDTHRHNIRATGNKRDYRARNGSERRRRNPEAT